MHRGGSRLKVDQQLDTSLELEGIPLVKEAHVINAD